ncbi:MAG: ABC-2 family transporter protein [Patescibacteria group bacterium]|nr:ABC-2 family transporter protein [Patescibacteria group bacterium]
MDNISLLAKIKPKNSLIGCVKKTFIRLGHIFEILALLLVWILIFLKKSNLGGMTIQEIATYILIGNLIALTNSFMLERIFAYDMVKTDSKLLMLKPFRYCLHLFSNGFAKFIFPFLSLAAFNIVILYFFINNLTLNLEPNYLFLIVIMIILAFIIEFFIAYLLRLFIFWTIESKEAYIFVSRLKNILAGSYFPLSLLPAIFLQISLFLPFAYSFFVPTQLLLGQIDFNSGLTGIYVQIFWILTLYAIIKLSWERKKISSKNQIKNYNKKL